MVSRGDYLIVTGDGFTHTGAPWVSRWFVIQVYPHSVIALLVQTGDYVSTQNEDEFTIDDHTVRVEVSK